MENSYFSYSNLKKWLSIVFVIIVSCVFLYFALQNANWTKIYKIILQTDINFIFIGIVLFIFSYFFKWLRWHIILKDLDSNISPVQTLNPFFGGFALNNFLPLRAGEAYRVLSLSKHSTISKTGSISTLMLDRILDGLTLVIILIYTLPKENNPVWLKNMLNISIWIFIGGFIVLFLIANINHILERIEKLFLKLHFELGFKLISKVVNALKIVKNPWQLLILTILSILVWLFEGGMYYCFAKSLSINISFTQSLLVLAIVNFGILIPASPGYIGTFEYFTVKALSLCFIHENKAISFSLLIHFIQIIFITIFGLIAYAFFKLNIKNKIITKGK